MGIILGEFLVDVANSAQLAVKLRAWAQENNMVVRYETLKARIRRPTGIHGGKRCYLLPAYPSADGLTLYSKVAFCDKERYNTHCNISNASI